MMVNDAIFKCDNSNCSPSSFRIKFFKGCWFQLCEINCTVKDGDR